MKKIALYFTNQIIKIDNEAEADREIYLYAFESIFYKNFYLYSFMHNRHSNKNIFFQ